MKEREEENKKIIDENIKDEKLKNLDGMSNNILAELAKAKILTIEDFADLASFELIDKEEGILKDLDIDEELINQMIMKAEKAGLQKKLGLKLEKDKGKKKPLKLSSSGRLQIKKKFRTII